MSNVYQAFGCLIKSEIPLPELVGAPGALSASDAEVTIQYGPVDRSALLASDDGVAVQLRPCDATFEWKEVGAFHVRAGTSITVDPAESVEADILRLPLLGVVFSSLLSQRGHTVLHASAVKLGDVVVGFLGNKGMGKSTTAAAFHRLGYRLITDDVLAVQYDSASNRFKALPAYSQLKLWPQAAAHVVEYPEQLRTLHRHVQKQAYAPQGEFPTDPLALARLYVLDWGQRTEINPLSQAEGFIHTVAHTFTQRYASSHPQALPPELERCRRLIDKVPVRLLLRRRSLEGLREIVEVVEQDLTKQRYN